MKRNRMRRFFQQKQYAIASFVLFVAIAAMTGVYVSNRITNERQEQELAQREQELSGADGQQDGKTAALDSDNTNPFLNSTKLSDAEEDAKSVTSIIKPSTKQGEASSNTDSTKDSKTGTEKENETDTPKEGQEAAVEKTGEPERIIEEEPLQEEQKKEKRKEGKPKQEAAAQSKAAVSLNFSPESDLRWPLQGDVILNYSMDQTVYFATLEQYKYNPALIIAGKVNDPVNAAATGKITDISANEETGITVTMDLGNGYSAVYGQLKEVLYKEGATVEAGNAIGYIAEPTKYYSVEGSNLYFELRKDKEPVNPLQYMQ